jgi:8-oxo-dGTP diphosphatase
MKYGTVSYLESVNGILMLKKFERENDPNSGYYAIPGGKLEDYERGLKCFKGRLESSIRETEDETGIKPINPILRGVILFDNKDRIFNNWKNPDNYLVYIFYSTQFSGRLKESDEGVPAWVHKRDIVDLPKNPGDKFMYKWLIDGREFMGIIKHKGNKIDKSGTWVDWI